MAKVDKSVKELVSMVDREELRLPEMQREYVWQGPRVRDLLDSLYRGYPSGVILAWESEETVATRAFAVKTSDGQGIRPLLLLDGQQRLTSLSAVLRGEPVTVRGRSRPIEILFNLDHPDELTLISGAHEAGQEEELGGDETAADIQERLRNLTFVISTKALESLTNWVRVTDVFTKEPLDLLEEKGFDIGLMDRDLRKRYTNRLQQLRGVEKYEYRMEILDRAKSYEEVTEIFVRVNSLGAKLRSSDLALAQITAKWRGSLEKFRNYQQKLDKRGFELDLSVILKTLVALISGQSKFKTVHSISLPQLEQGWDRTVKALDFALNFSKSNLAIDSPTLLSSPSLFVSTAFWADQRQYNISPEDSDGFRKWFLIANAKGRYSRGSSETLLDQDLLVLRGDGGGPELLNRLTQQVGRLDFTVEELLGRTSRSGAFKTMFLAFRKEDARDWSTNLAISPKHSGKADKIEYHHIFPKAYLRQVRPDIQRSEVDDIANLAFISGATNRRISSKAPADYKSDFPKGALTAQQIYFEGALDGPENFEAFSNNRRRRIVERINEFLDVVESS
jgi:hypothetical protein